MSQKLIDFTDKEIQFDNEKRKDLYRELNCICVLTIDIIFGLRFYP